MVVGSVSSGPWQFNRGYIEPIKSSNDWVLAVREGATPVVEMNLRRNKPNMQWRIEQPYFYITMHDGDDGERVLTVKKHNGQLDPRRGSMLVLERKSDEANKLWSWNNGLLVNKLSGLALDVINGKMYQGIYHDGLFWLLKPY